MEKRTTSPYPRIDRRIMAAIGVVLVIATALFMWSDRAHDWRFYQMEFGRMVAEQFGEDRAALLPKGVQQIWVADLSRADRCITCHQAVAYKGFEQAEHPYRTHPIEPLKQHPVEDYGCTSCHGGQGWAIDTADAHGEVAHWEEPLLSRSLGEAYTLAGNENALMQMNCNTCHRYDRQTAGAGAINLAKSLVNDKGCRACHVINGFGGTIGPDLTAVGEKPPEQYELSRLSGHRTAFAWHVAHFKDPRAMTEGTVMPNFNFTTEQAQSLSMLMLSWKRNDVPARYVAGAPRTDPRSPEELAAEAAMRSGPGGWFVQTGCFVCHSISVFGVKSPAQIGPDLSMAVEDVQSRFGVTIDQFLANPTGTMSVVLSRQIILTPEQKQVAIQKLRDAFAEYQRQRGAATTAAGGR
jgi:cbb3-type cytochrome oxidase cytochrome c subunit